MGIGYNIKKKVMAYEKAKARKEASLYGISAEKSDAYVDQRRKEEYILKQKVEREAKEKRMRENANSGGFLGHLKKSAKGYSKHLKGKKKSNMGLKNVSMGGSGPEFGLVNKSATDIKVNRKKGPFDF
jgi:hypothetical protein